MGMVNKQINEADSETKLKSENYADKHRGGKQPNFTVGDQVLVRQRMRYKLTSRVVPKPYEITDIRDYGTSQGTSDNKKLFPYSEIQRVIFKVTRVWKT